MPRPTPPLAAAVAGTGFIGRVHTEALRRAGVVVRGVLASHEEGSRAAAAALGVPRAYRSFDELLADREVQVVHVATPNRHHFPMVRDALAAGKHVMCEKPLAMTAAETATLATLAARSGLCAGVCYNVRFYPLAIEARERIARGELGAVFSVVGSYVQDWLLHAGDYNWRVRADEGGPLRAVADIGTHWLDLVQHVTGRAVVEVCADLQTVHPVRQRPLENRTTFANTAGATSEPVVVDTEDAGAVLLRLAGGARGVLWVSQVTAGRKNRVTFEVAGARRALAWNSERPDALWIGRRDGGNELLPRDPGLLSAAARGATSYPGGHNEGFADTFKQLFRAFYAHVAEAAHAPPYPTFADGHRELLICEAVARSHRERRWVAIEKGDTT